MENLLSRLAVSITDLRKRPAEIIQESVGETVAILNHNKPAAYLVSPAMYEKLMDLLEDEELNRIADARQGEKALANRVTLDELRTRVSAKRGKGME